MESKARIALKKKIMSSNNPDVQALLSSGRLRFDNFTQYFRGSINDLTGIQELIDISLPEDRGAVNVDKGKLPEGEIFAFEKVAIRIADSTATDAKAVNTYSGDVQAWPAAVRNGEFIVKQNEGEKFRIAAVMCGGNAESDMASGMTDAYRLEEAVVIESKQVFETLFEFAKGQAASGTNTIYIEVLLIGLKTKVRADS